jgi:D-beta-D-heptose 7-phosphate kinase/D-beta-D-heptose 1-phosphate adenosyltransferase
VVDMGKVLSLDDLSSKRTDLRKAKKTLVFSNGCFDLLHLGHVRYLREARELGDALAIGLNSDASTRRIKGDDRPILPQEERAEILAALECVDYIVIFDEPTAEQLVAILKPDIYVKGGDYTLDELPEAKIVEDYGGKVIVLPLVPGHSTTRIIERILSSYGEKQA